MRQADVYLYDRRAGRLTEDETGYTFQQEKTGKMGEGGEHAVPQDFDIGDDMVVLDVNHLFSLSR